MTFKKILKNSFIYIISALGAIGTGLQNYMASIALINNLATGHTAFALCQGLAIGLGGICSGLVNFFINKELLKNFWKRINGKYHQPQPTLTDWQTFKKWFGCAVFIATGILFGMTAFAFGPIGPLAAISIAAGFFVACIMIIQELETWLESFDAKSEDTLNAEQETPSSAGKITGHIIALGNVIALSLLFAFGLGTFFICIGMPALPAIILSFGIAFTAGAFTEFYFYNYFISSFCEKIQTKWQAFWMSNHSPLGLTISAINAVVNGVLSYVGIMSAVSLLTAASIAIPPVGIIIAIAAIVSTFAAAASFLLAIDFWKRNNTSSTSDENKIKQSTTVEMLTVTQATLKKETKPLLNPGKPYTPSNTSTYKNKNTDHTTLFPKPKNINKNHAKSPSPAPVLL